MTHLCFADGLLLFSAATVKSVQTIKGVLQDFAGFSGLSANPNKSLLYCVGVNQLEKENLVECLQIKEGQLHARNLGFPLISRKLTIADCGIVIEKISVRIDSNWVTNN